MKHNISNNFILFFFLLLISCGTIDSREKSIDALFSVELLSDNFNEQIKYQEEQGLIIIPVEINNRTYSFLFDTGAITMVSSSIVDELEIISKNNIKGKISDSRGNSQLSNIKTLESLSISDVKFENIPVNVVDLSSFNESCVNIDGIIGTNILKKCFWKINYTNKTLELSDSYKNISIKDPEIIIPFKENISGNPISRMSWSQFSFMSTWDTGYNGQIQIPDSLFFNGKKSDKMKLIRGRGISNKSLYEQVDLGISKYQSIIDSLMVDIGKDKFYLKDQFIEIAPHPAPSLLGNNFIASGKEVLFDWENRQIILKKAPTSKINETFGFAPFKIGSKVTVVSIWEKSQAYKNGVRLGDTIVSFFNKNVENLTQEEWCKTFKDLKTKNQLEFSINKNNGLAKFNLKTENLFE